VAKTVAAELAAQFPGTPISSMPKAGPARGGRYERWGLSFKRATSWRRIPYQYLSHYLASLNGAKYFTEARGGVAASRSARSAELILKAELIRVESELSVSIRRRQGARLGRGRPREQHLRSRNGRTTL